MAALDVIGLDVEIWHALGPGTGAEREVAVGLEGNRTLGVVADLDQPGVDALRAVLHGPFEQQITVGLGRSVVLQRAEVVHLRAVGVVQGDLAGGGTLSRDPCLGTHTCVVAAEGDGGEQGGRVTGTDRTLMSELPGVIAEHVDTQVPQPSRLGHVHLEAGHAQGTKAVRRQELLDHGESAVGGSIDDETWEHGNAVGVEAMRDDDGLADRSARRHADDHGVHERVVQLVEEVDRILGTEPVTQLGTHGHGDSVGCIHRGHGVARHERLEVEFGDPAVSPDLFVRRGHRGGGCTLGRSEAQWQIW